MMNPELDKFISAISKSSVLTALIEDLENSSPELRDATVIRLISEMTEAKVSPEYIGHISFLRDATIFNTIVATLKRHGNTAEQDAAANP